MLKVLIAVMVLALSQVSFASNAKCVQFLNNQMPRSTPVLIKEDGSLYQVPSPKIPFGGKRKIISAHLDDTGASYRFEDTSADPVSTTAYSLDIPTPQRRLPDHWNGPRRVVIGLGGQTRDYSLGSLQACDIDQITFTQKGDPRKYIFWEENFCSSIAKYPLDEQHEKSTIAAFSKQYKELLAIPGNKGMAFGFEQRKYMSPSEMVAKDISLPRPFETVNPQELTIAVVEASQKQCAYEKNQLLDPQTSRLDNVSAPGSAPAH